MMLDRPLTVVEACQHMGVSERTLRRILRDPKMAAKTQAEYRQTRTGQRLTILLTSQLMIEIAEVLAQANQENAGRNTGRTQAEVIAHYERLLAEKDARIAELSAALEHERAQSHRHADAHARAQDLLKSPEPRRLSWLRPSLLERLVKRRR